MSLPAFMQKGLSALLNVVRLTDPVSINRAVNTIEQHFSFSAYEIAQAYQRSYESALTAISGGLSKQSLLDSKVMDEFANQIFTEFLLPFVSHYGMSEEAIEQFCNETRQKCQALIQCKGLLFQGEETLLSEADLASLVTDHGSLSITELVIDQLYFLEQTRPYLDEQFVAFLRYHDLLGSAILFFLHELLRQEPRVEVTLSALQRQGLWQDVRDLKKSLKEIMSRLALSEQVKPHDELTQHNSESLNLIKEAFAKLKTLPTNNPQYSQLVIMGGSMLSSTGALKEAENLFSQAREIAQNDADKALAAFNLFQVCVRNQDFEQALPYLQEAIKLEPHRFALHDVEKYPMERILGAGGMGCVFLCRHKLQKRRVVVKCFWENRKGKAEEVFKEAFAMSDIADEYVPAPLDYGYVDPVKQERAFFVTEHIEDAIDGETWLKQYGKLNLADGLQVGLKIAEGLQVAHEAGVVHLDLKPANILVLKKSAEVSKTSEIAVKIIDFGLAQVAKPLQQQQIQHSSQIQLSRFGKAVFGTLDYAAPEQQGEEQYGEPGTKSDVFAFGKTLYRLLSGKQARHNLRQRDLPKVPKLYEFLEDCVEEDPKDRPESAQELIIRLQEIQAKMEPQPGEDSPQLAKSEPQLAKENLPEEAEEAEKANILADQYYHEKNFAQAIQEYRKAAEFGYALGQYNLGLMYRQGKGVAADDSEAAFWYQKAAEQGHAWAQHNLGWLYKNGAGVKQDNHQAFYWFHKAAEQGHASGQSNLGFLYKTGKGVAQDDTQAIYWFRKAAQQGNAWGQYNLAWMYEKGKGVKADNSQAVYWYRKAAEQGHADSQYNLGMKYEKGKGIKRDEQQATIWYRKAAEQGHANAQNSLGWLYQHGKGIDQDFTQAIYWYRKAAEQGQVWGQNNLGWMYEQGKGVEPDETKAIYWYRKAATQGHAIAKKALERLGESS